MDETRDTNGRTLDLALVRLPTFDERLVRVRDGERFRVTQVDRIEGGEVRITMRSEKGDVVRVGTDDLFPPLHVPQPFRHDR